MTAGRLRDLWEESYCVDDQVYSSTTNRRRRHGRGGCAPALPKSTGGTWTVEEVPKLAPILIVRVVLR